MQEGEFASHAQMTELSCNLAGAMKLWIEWQFGWDSEITQLRILLGQWKEWIENFGWGSEMSELRIWLGQWNWEILIEFRIWVGQWNYWIDNFTGSEIVELRIWLGQWNEWIEHMEKWEFGCQIGELSYNLAATMKSVDFGFGSGFIIPTVEILGWVRVQFGF